MTRGDRSKLILLAESKTEDGPFDLKEDVIAEEAKYRSSSADDVRLEVEDGVTIAREMTEDVTMYDRSEGGHDTA